MGVSSYEKLDVWQESINLVTDVYSAVKLLPKEELYALSDQIRRAAVSIPLNIAEGQQRQSTKDFINFLVIARGSLGELKTQIIICGRLGYLNTEKTRQLENKCDQVGRMINGLIRSIMEKQQKNTRNQQPATNYQAISHQSLKDKLYD